MSRRTFLANKAINEAWENEKNLIQNGKGTRNWTPDQQQSILDRGKAYDDSGKAFEGQHMKSVDKYPEFQGDFQNIQFLTRQEHLEAHKGNWQTPTNWRYDPNTKEFFDFGEGKYIPCEVIPLDDPVVLSGDKKETEFENIETTAEGHAVQNENGLEKSKKAHHSNSLVHNQCKGLKKQPTNKVVAAAKGVGKFVWKNKGIVAGVGIGAAGVAFTVATKGHGLSVVNNLVKNTNITSIGKYVNKANVGKEIINRASPRGHIVSGYTRMQNGKLVKVRPYPRGKF